MKPGPVILLLALFLAPHYMVNGQYNFREGRIITQDNDTLSGFISDRGTIRNSKVCLYKESKKAAITKYYPKDIRSYQLAGEKYYVSKNILVNNKFRDCFIDVMLEGRVSLYHYYRGKEFRYFIQKDSGELFGLSDRKYFIPIPGSGNLSIKRHEYGIEHAIYKDMLVKLFGDCPAVAYQAYDADYNTKALTNITKAYIGQTCNEEKCVSFERDLRRMKDRVGIYSGVQLSKIYYSGMEMQSLPQLALPFGILYNVTLSLISPKLSFQTELSGKYLSYSSDLENLPNNFDDLSISTWLLGLPMSFRYQINHGKLYPYLGVGKDLSISLNPKVEYYALAENEEGQLEQVLNQIYLHRFQKGGWFLDAGVGYEISPYFSLFANLRFQRYRSKIIADGHENIFIYKNADGVEYTTNFVALQVGVMVR